LTLETNLIPEKELVGHFQRSRGVCLTWSGRRHSDYQWE